MILSGTERSKLCAFFNSYMYSVLGRGPREVKVVSRDDTIEVIATGVLTPIEKTYYRICQDATLIHKLRSDIFEASFEQFRQEFEAELGFNLVELSSYTDCESDTRIFVFKINRLDQTN